MAPRRQYLWFGSVLLAALASGLGGCENYFFLPGLGNTGAATASGIAGLGSAFTQQLIQSRTFLHGTAVTTATYAVADYRRVPLAIDFNNDGKLDPVICYGDRQAVIQILLSRGDTGTVNPFSLTLDSKRDMKNLSDVAVGDVNNDGYLDIVAAAEAAVWYFRHPTNGVTTNLRDWGAADPNDPLRERIDASYRLVTDNELLAMIAQAAGPGLNLDDYVVTVQQLYTNVELADLDRDGDLDVVTSRSFIIDMTPRPGSPVDPIQIVDGDVMVFVNPGAAVDGLNWTQLSIGRHERQQRLDRDGATGLLVQDMDGDGWLDVISAAREDNNAQVAWFRNPGGALTTANPWTQYRIGSVRDCWSIDVGDVTGDQWPDVVASGGAQMQLILYVNPAVAFPNQRYEYDWDAHVIAEFTTYEPRDIKLLDLDNDGELEIVLGGTAGALRLFQPPANPTNPWTGSVIVTFSGGGTVGLLGYGDMDGDGDLDLVATVDAIEDTDSRTVWIKNSLAR